MPASARLADRWWLLVHTGDPLAPRIGPRALEFGCAAAVLAELALTGTVTLRPTVRPGSYAPPPSDVLAMRVVSLVQEAPGLDLGTWVQYLRWQAVLVRARLLLKRLLEETTVTVGRLRPATDRSWQVTSDLDTRDQTELAGALAMPGQLLGGSGVLTVPDDVELTTVTSLSRTTGLLQLLVRAGHEQQVDDWSRRLPAAVAPLLNLVRALLDEATTP